MKKKRLFKRANPFKKAIAILPIFPFFLLLLILLFPSFLSAHPKEVHGGFTDIAFDQKLRAHGPGEFDYDGEFLDKFGNEENRSRGSSRGSDLPT